ncbi:MAG: hypothetical protein ABIA83_01630 [Patescibacteria group bacterium]
MTKYRMIRKSYILGTESEDGPGSTTNVTQSDGGTEMIWDGRLDTQPTSQWLFDNYGIEIYEDSGHEMGYEPGTGNIGDSEYRYILEELEDGKWSYCTDLQPYEPPVEPSSPYWEDPEDLDDEDDIPDHEQSVPYWEDPEWISEQERLATEYRAKHGH